MQIPIWAQGEALSHALIRQKRVFDERRQIEVFGLARPMELEKASVHKSSISTFLERRSISGIPRLSSAWHTFVHEAHVDSVLGYTAVHAGRSARQVRRRVMHGFNMSSFLHFHNSQLSWTLAILSV